MKYYRLKKPHYINEALVEAGSVVGIEDENMVSRNMVEVNKDGSALDAKDDGEPAIVIRTMAKDAAKPTAPITTPIASMNNPEGTQEGVVGSPGDENTGKAISQVGQTGEPTIDDVRAAAKKIVDEGDENKLTKTGLAKKVAVVEALGRDVSQAVFGEYVKSPEG